jgi:hypothetical protein
MTLLDRAGSSDVMTTMMLLGLTLSFAIPGPYEACTVSDRQPPLRVSVTTLGVRGPLRTAPIIEEVARLWAPYGVHFAWHLTTPSGGVAHEKTPVDVWIQLVHETPHSKDARGPHVLGRVMFLEGQPLRIVRIPVAAATNVIRDVYRNQGATFHDSFAAHTRVLERALGRAIAHELGHILLRSARHTTSGLMSAHLRGTLLISADPVDLGLDQTHVAGLRKWLDARRQSCDAALAAR